MRPILAAAVLLAALGGASALWPSPGVAAAAAASPAQVQAVAARLRPTSCTPTLSAADCPTTEAAQFRARVATLLAQGMTPRQVVRSFVRAYGPQVLFVPPSRGAAALIWVLPFSGVAVGGAIWWRFVRSRGAAKAAGAPASGDPPADGDIDPGLSDYL